MWKDFKEFAMRGNVIDLAVGVIIGAAFGKITNSLVTDILMPPLGLLIGRVDFSELAVTLKPAADGAKAVTMNYGLFLNAIINFLIIAFAVFLMVRAINRLKRQAPPPAPAPTERACPECAMLVPIAAKRCGHCTSVFSN